MTKRRSVLHRTKDGRSIFASDTLTDSRRFRMLARGFQLKFEWEAAARGIEGCPFHGEGPADN